MCSRHYPSVCCMFGKGIPPSPRPESAGRLVTLQIVSLAVWEIFNSVPSRLSGPEICYFLYFWSPFQKSPTHVCTLNCYSLAGSRPTSKFYALFGIDVLLAQSERDGSSVILLHEANKFSCTICWKSCLFFQWLFWHLYCKRNGHSCECLFWVLSVLFCSVLSYCMPLLCQYHTIFITLSLSIMWDQVLWFLEYHPFCLGLLWIRILCFYLNFFLLVLWKCRWNLNGGVHWNFILLWQYNQFLQY